MGSADLIRANKQRPVANTPYVHNAPTLGRPTLLRVEAQHAIHRAGIASIAPTRGSC